MGSPLVLLCYFPYGRTFWYRWHGMCLVLLMLALLPGLAVSNSHAGLPWEKAILGRVESQHLLRGRLSSGPPTLLLTWDISGFEGRWCVPGPLGSSTELSCASGRGCVHCLQLPVSVSDGANHRSRCLLSRAGKAILCGSKCLLLLNCGCVDLLLQKASWRWLMLGNATGVPCPSRS